MQIARERLYKTRPPGVGADGVGAGWFLLEESTLEVMWILCVLLTADDMGLGKTLTMIALILAKKNQQRSKEEDRSVPVTCLSKNGSYAHLLPVLLIAASQGRVQAAKGDLCDIYFIC